MTPQERLAIIIVAIAAATLVAAFLLITLRKSLEDVGSKILAEQSKREPEQPPLPRVGLSFEMIPKDEATSLLMGTLTNTGDLELRDITISSSMENMIFAMKSFAYIDEVNLIPNNGEFILTPGSSMQLCLGSIKLTPRLESSYLKSIKRSPSPILTIALSTPQLEESIAVSESELNDEFEEEIPTVKPSKERRKSGEKKPSPMKKSGAKVKVDKKAEREAKKLEQKRERERKKIAQEEKKAARKKGESGKGKRAPEAVEEVITTPIVLAPKPLNATFSMPLQYGFFPQAEAQMLYFYKRDMMFERADTKGEVFENTMTFDGSPTRNLYRVRSGK